MQKALKNTDLDWYLDEINLGVANKKYELEIQKKSKLKQFA